MCKNFHNKIFSNANTFLVIKKIVCPARVDSNARNNLSMPKTIKKLFIKYYDRGKLYISYLMSCIFSLNFNHL